MAKISLVDLIAAVDTKYEPFEVLLPNGKTLRLRPVLRMPDDEREALRAIQERREVAGEAIEDFDMEGYLRDLIRAVADDKDLADVLFAVEQANGLTVGDDLGILSEIVSEYSEATQLGEAQPSEN